jgi:hypothetical protein
VDTINFHKKLVPLEINYFDEDLPSITSKTSDQALYGGL